MHIALYRKYRPKTFSRVVGQKYVVEALKNQIAGGKIGHAFLFTGVRGTGKTTCAKIFAKAVNCLNPINGEPCLECEICRGIENESILDVTEMDAASNNSVEDIRDVLNEVNYLPVAAKYRVYIIDEVHMLSPAAFNALLKTLEEPPAHVIFILATTEIHKVPATILSRCQRYDFTKLSVEEIADSLLEIAGQEGISLTPGAAKMIASLSDGAMRDANSILDTCIAMGGSVDEDVVSNIAGVTKDEDMIAFADCLIEGDSASALQKLRALWQESADMRRLCEELISHFSNLLLANMAGTTAQLLNISDEKLQKLRTQSAKCPPGLIYGAIDCFTDALDGISKGQNSKIAMDMAVFKICQGPAPQTQWAQPRPRPRTQRPANPAPQTARRRERPAAAVTEEKPSIPARPAARQEAPARSAPQKETGEGKPEIFSYWPAVVEEIGKVDTPLHSFIRNSQAYLYQGIVYIKGSEGLNNYIRTNREVNSIIKKAIQKACGRMYNIGGFKNIAHLFAEAEHSSLPDILALRDSGVQVNIKD